MARKRLTGEEARARILDAAYARMRVDGPQGLKLTALAKDLGVSHQAILHHFGSRDGLVAAVTRRILDQLSADLIGGLQVFEDRDAGAAALIERAFEVLVDQGHGRWLAWLALTGAEPEQIGQRPLALLSEMAHVIREREHGPTDRRDTTFTLILLVYALLGASVLETGTFQAIGLGDDPDAPRDFRQWLRALVLEHLEREG